MASFSNPSPDGVDAGRREATAPTPGTPAPADLHDAVLPRDLAAFAVRAFGTVDPGTRYLTAPHAWVIAERLEACARGETTRLIVNLPPRSMKSILVSVAWPAWLIGRDPTTKIMAASYSERLAVKHALDFRLVLQAPWYRRLFAGVALAPDQNEKHKIQTTQRGHRIATGVGGTATGEGADVLIVDDPHNPRQALSEAQRRMALDWFDQTFATRLNDKRRGAIVVVMQRLHVADLTGHLLKKGGWEHLSLPAEAEAAERHPVAPGRFFERAAGEPLHPAREGSAELARARQELGSYAYAAQYQQRPVPLAGGMVSIAWFRRWRAAPAGARIVLSWDTASKGRAHNDPSACGVWAETAAGHFLLDVLRRRMDYPELRRAALSLAATWRPAAVLIEDQASGQALAQDLAREPGVPVIALRPEGDKATRMARVSPVIEGGRVFLPERAPWLADYEAEIAAFPEGAHDDQADMTSQYLEWARRRSTGPRIRGL